MTYLSALAFLAIIAALACALFFMLRGGQAAPGASKKMAHAPQAPWIFCKLLISDESRTQ
jgi:hypothetical protein